MKRVVCLLLFVLLLLSSATAAFAAPGDWVGKTFPDFTVAVYGGETFTLSEALETHDLVVVNFWASWCGPCQYEFPYLELAYERYADRVAVIALSVESRDSEDTLREFVEYFRLTFDVARDQDDLFAPLDSMGIPTTLIIGAGREVLAAEVGAKVSISAFTDWFDSLLPQAAVEAAE